MAAQYLGGSDRCRVDEKGSSEQSHATDGEDVAADARRWHALREHIWYWNDRE